MRVPGAYRARLASIEPDASRPGRRWTWTLGAGRPIAAKRLAELRRRFDEAARAAESDPSA